VWVHTSDTAAAGSEANVKMMVYGGKDRTSTIQLKKGEIKFTRSGVKSFDVDFGVDVGKPYKVRIWHKASCSWWCGSGWMLDKV
jgi:hypothetical protein